MVPLLPGSAKARLHFAGWGPTANQLVFIFENNVYFKSSVEDNPIKLTSSSTDSYIYNGIPDWLYEEEILSSSDAIWWSPDGSKLCFASFNDSLVDTVSYSIYGNDLNQPYPSIFDLKYPKVSKTASSI
jgi:dipeptidyl peptidase IV, putative (fragment)